MSKKAIFGNLLIITLLFLFSCKKEEKTPVEDFVINGKIEGYKGGDLILFDIKSFYNDTIKPNEDGTFSKAIQLPKSPNDMFLNFLNNSEHIYIYVQDGFHTTINATFADNILPKFDFDGDGKFENEYNIVLYRRFNPYKVPQDETDRIKSISTFKEYEERINAREAECRKLLAKITDSIARVYKENQLECAVQNYKFKYLNEHEEAKNDEDFRNFVRSIDLNKINYAQDEDLTSSVISWEIDQLPESTENRNILYLDLLKSKIHNQEALNIASTNMMNKYFMNSDDDVVQIFKKYKQICTDDDAIDSFDDRYDKVKSLLKGAKAPDFTMQAADEKIYKLSDFKGKMLFIDIWATWCIPCKKETPALDSLVTKFSTNPNIDFISISIDENIQEWRDTIDNRKPQWKQFIVNKENSAILNKEYNINAIPRYMLIDKKGKIVAISAPRPSNEDIENFINKNLEDD